VQESPLRFVLLCDSLELPNWQADCLGEAIGHGVARPVGVVLRAPRPQPGAKSQWRKRWADRRLLLWRLFNRLYVARVSTAVAPSQPPEWLQDVPVYTDEPLPVGRFAEALSDGALDFVRALEPDFVLRFGFGILTGGVLGCAKYGVWSYHHGDPARFRGQPPGFWEILHGSATAGVVLQVLRDELDAGTILHRGHFQVTGHSYAKTRDTLYSGAASWVRRACADIIANGWRTREPPAGEAHGPVFRQPTNRVMIKFLLITALNFLKNQVAYKLHRQSWNCAITPYPVHVVAGLCGNEQQREALAQARWMPAAPGSFQADPFGYAVQDGSGVRVLYELFPWSTDRGVIAARDYSEGKFGPAEVLLDAPTHLSYPYVLRIDGSLHFIPEHSAAGDISAYRITDPGPAEGKTAIFPHSELLDATILERDGKFWLFGLDERSSKNTDLHIFFADRIVGPWSSHPLNPVKSDVRSARPAGPPFEFEGRLFRPSQDCSTHYGSAVTVNEVTVLNERDFAEQPVARVAPVPGGGYGYGLHTLSAVGDLTLIDGAQKQPLFRARARDHRATE
jgi:hypothetical protein